MDPCLVLVLVATSAALKVSAANDPCVDVAESRLVEGKDVLIQLPTNSYLYSPLSPYTRLITPAAVLRLKHRGSPIGLPDVFDKPVVLLVKAEGGEDELVAYLFEGGLLDIPDNPSTVFIQEALESGDADKLALLFRPATFPNLQQLRLGRLPLTRFVVPQGINVAKLTRLSEEELPWLLILDRDEVGEFDVDKLKHMGDVDVSSTTLDVIKIMTKIGFKLSGLKSGGNKAIDHTLK